jgi:integrase
MKAAKLDAELLERWYARLQRCRSACDGRGRSAHTCRPLSSSTVRKIHFVLSAALGRAVRWDHIPVNRAELAEPPSPAATEPDPPTAAEAAQLLGEAWAADPDWGLLLWLTMVTGSRRGEVSALRWRHVDSAGALLTLHRSNAQPKAGLREKETKTRQQRRVMLDPQTLAFLTAHRAECERRCAALGVSLDPDMAASVPQTPTGTVITSGGPKGGRRQVGRVEPTSPGTSAVPAPVRRMCGRAAPRRGG